MKKTYIQPEAKAFTVKTENLMEMSAGFGEDTDVQNSKEYDLFANDEKDFSW